MKAELFLDIEVNTGDGFSYEILPMEKKIPLYYNPVTLVHSDVRIQQIDSSNIHVCVDSPAGFNLVSRVGGGVFGTEETELCTYSTSNSTYHCYSGPTPLGGSPYIRNIFYFFLSCS